VLVLCTEAKGAGDALAQAAAVAVAAAGRTGAALLVAVEEEPRRRAGTLLAAPEARELEAVLRAGGFATASARGRLCQVSLPADAESVEALAELEELALGMPVFACVPGELWSASLAAVHADAGLLSARLPRDRALAVLVAGDLRERGLRAKVALRPLGRIAGRRALSGLEPGGRASSRAARMARALAAAADSSGQALPALLGAAAMVMVVSLFLVAIGGAVTGKGRAQRGADLAAISAARSMRDDIPRLSAPALLPNGVPNPRHLSRRAYFARAAAAAKRAARANGIAAARVEVAFPDAAKPLPIRSRVTVSGEVEGAAVRVPVVARATAEASPPGGSGDWTGEPAVASGGGYSGPLEHRDGEGMRPDVAEAYDRMVAVARGAGLTLMVNSGFRSDAEQAQLFAEHPDPTWVARPGTSLHRCATELDLGPPSAYGWLASHARSFGFVQRYSWEAWHYGFTAGPPPCSAAGNSVTAGGAADGREAQSGVPSFVPAVYREPLRRAATRWRVPAAVLAAQLMAESGFNPRAVSPVGAQGIAQFMPGTAASYGLTDPFDPVAAIDAQAHLMSDLLRQFRSIPLALAAYNAGPGAVSACGCSTPFAETAAYVARILALLGGSGAMPAPQPEVRLVS
jgi:hypothetical protein